MKELAGRADVPADAKALVPKAVAEANALFERAAALGGVLAPYKVTLTAPAPVR